MLASLADREISGSVKNTRLAVRKQRDGVSGFELPFTAHMIETGVDSDGDPMTSPPVIEWAAPGQVTTSNADALWTPSMQLLRRILTTALAESGKPVRPRLDGPEVVACESELVRAPNFIGSTPSPTATRNRKPMPEGKPSTDN